MNVFPYEEPEFGFFPYDPTISAFAETIEGKLAAHFPGCTVAHVGSTAIPGMPGKNSINIMVALPREAFPSAIESLEDLGFGAHPTNSEPDDRPVRVGMVSDGTIRRAVHVKVVEALSRNHLDSLFFGEYLRAHPDDAERYASLKKSLFEKGSTPYEYAVAKQPFIMEVISKRTDQ